MRVLIVGAGPAGLSCAISILEKRSDADVLIVERKWHINPVCAGGLGFYAINRVKNYVDIPMDVVQHVVKRFTLILGSNKWEITADDLGIDRLGYVIDRQAFDKYLLNVARKLGARLRRHADGWTITDRFDYIVDAAGVYSSIKYTSRDEMAMCIQKTHERMQKNMLIYMCRQLKTGYIWCFPADGKVKVGAGYSPNDQVGRIFAHGIVRKPGRLLTKYYSRGKGKLLRKPLPLSKPLNLIDGKIIKVGTAGRLVCPVTGAGIMFAIISGFEAGTAIAADKPKLYIKNMKPILKDLNRRYIFKKVIYPLNEAKIEKIYKILHEFKPKSTDISSEVRRLIKFTAKKYPAEIFKLLPAIFRWW